VRAAVLSHLGLTLSSTWMFAPELASGEVKTVLDDWHLPARDLWAVYHRPHGERQGAGIRGVCGAVVKALTSPAAQQPLDRVRQRAGVIQHEQPCAIGGDQRCCKPHIARQARLDIRQRLTPPRDQALTQHRLIDRQQQHQQGGIALASLRQMCTRAVDQHIVPGCQPVIDFLGIP
jgi:hypothetical protein